MCECGVTGQRYPNTTHSCCQVHLIRNIGGYGEGEHKVRLVMNWQCSKDYYAISTSDATSQCSGRVRWLTLNPLTTEFFPPRQHIFMHSAHTTFVGTPLPQHSLLSGQTLWARTHGETPLVILLMIFMTPTSPVIRGQRWMSAGFSPSISLNLGQIWLMAHLTPPICMLSWGPGWGLWISLKSKILRSMNLIKIKLPTTCPPFQYPPPPRFYV